MTRVILSDGAGTGQDVAVLRNRIQAESIARAVSTAESIAGNAYNINTGIINLTSANKSAVLYIKNNGDRSIVIENLVYLIGTSTGGSGNVLITVLRNPTTGTIITNQVIAEMAGVNRNFGSSKLLDADTYKGAEGATFTSGQKVIETLETQSPKRVFISVGDIIIPKAASLGINFTPGTGNTSLNIEIAASCYVNEEI